MLILGINLFHGDASAAIVKDGKVLFAVAEERLNRVKHFGGVPVLSIRACLEAVGADLSDLDHVAVGRNPQAHLARKALYALSHPNDLFRLTQMRRRTGKALGDLKNLLAGALRQDPKRLRFHLHPVEHHKAHIASAFYCSGWEKAAGFSFDGSGDFVTALFARCQGTEIEVLDRVFVPHSLGSFYTMICEFLGYGKFGDEGKVMGMAAYGKDSFLEQVRQIVAPRGSAFRLDLNYFLPLGSSQGMRIAPDGTVHLARHYGPKMVERFGPPRSPDAQIGQRDLDLAFAMQKRFEEITFHLLNQLHKKVPWGDLVMAGGCALNSVSNGKIFSETPFRRTWIQPAAGDEGLSIGAALYAAHAILKEPRRYVMTDSYLGPEFSEERIRQSIEGAGLSFQRLEREPLLEAAADQIAAGRVVGWFQGRMEWGPRALGNRSILTHPGLPQMKDVLNARVKHREWFRPFAPAILAEFQQEYFEQDHPSPFMLHVYKIRPDKRKQLCAVNHADNTGRLQTVSLQENPLFYDLIRAFHRRTGIPALLNTSFNENEPIVCAPEEAVDCFLRTKMDALAMGPFLVLKENPR